MTEHTHARAHTHTHTHTRDYLIMSENMSQPDVLGGAVLLASRGSRPGMLLHISQ